MCGITQTALDLRQYDGVPSAVRGGSEAGEKKVRLHSGLSTARYRRGRIAAGHAANYRGYVKLLVRPITQELAHDASAIHAGGLAVPVEDGDFFALDLEADFGHFGAHDLGCDNVETGAPVCVRPVAIWHAYPAHVRAHLFARHLAARRQFKSLATINRDASGAPVGDRWRPDPEHARHLRGAAQFVDDVLHVSTLAHR